MSPMKIFEYMAAGKPMLVSDMPVLREVLCDRENALLVPCADIDSWVAAIDTMADPRIRARIGECARRDFLQKHTWKRRAEHVLKDTLTGK
jgi:glycosyltransferase involved in cell wall biosynthesis